MIKSREQNCEYCNKRLKWPEMPLRFRQWDIGQGSQRVVRCPACQEMQPWRPIIFRWEEEEYQALIKHGRLAG